MSQQTALSAFSPPTPDMLSLHGAVQTPKEPSSLDRRRKAAMVVQLLLGGGQKLALSRLPEDAQVALTHELAQLRLIDRHTLESVAEEFAQALEEIGLAAAGGVEATLQNLSGQLSAGAQARLRRELAARNGVDPWTAVLALPVNELAPMMLRESVEVAAVALSKLPVNKAAELLGKIPGDSARRITHAMSQTGAVRPETVAAIGAALAMEYASPADAAFPAPPAERLGAILNSSLSGTRDAVLQSLEAEDADFAQNVRRTLLTFGDLPQRLNPLDVPRLLRGIPQEDVVTALTYAATSSAAEAESATFILGNLSQRMADALREAMAERSAPRRAEGEAAFALILNNLRDKQAEGDITLLPLPDEDDAPAP